MVQILYKYQFIEFYTQSKGSDRSGSAQWCSNFFGTEGSHWLRALPAMHSPSCWGIY